MAIINVDVDGVVCEFVPGLFSALRGQGFDPAHHTDPRWRTWDIFQRMDEEMRAASMEILKDHNFWLDLPVVGYAQEAIEGLREAGHKIHWVTSPWEPCFGWRDARRDWLEANFSHQTQKIGKDLTVTGDKSRIWADIFIDDKPDHIEHWHAHHTGPGHRGILYKTNFNHFHHDDLEHIEWSPETVDMIVEWLAEKYLETEPL